MSKKLTFAVYVERAEALYRDSKAGRRGQIYWNLLVEERPDLSRDPDVRAVDPFYADRHLVDFLGKVEKLW